MLQNLQTSHLMRSSIE